MDRNGGAIILPADAARWEATLQQAQDAGGQTFAGVDQAHLQYVEGDLQQLDQIEAETLATIGRLQEEVKPEFVQPKVDAVVQEALARLTPFEAHRVARLESELARLQALRPKPAEVSEIEQHRQTSLTLYRLEQLRGYPLEIERGRSVPADLNDPLHFSALFETLLSAGHTKALSALLDDALDRHLRFLTAEQRERGQASLGLALSPDLKRQIDGYAQLIQRYRGKFSGMKRRFAERGWTGEDPLQALAGPAPRD
jgi:hypothetical protein